MQGKKLFATVAAALSITFATFGTAQADDTDNVVRLGYAHVKFNLNAGDLQGPPGTTPPGLRIGAESVDIPAISYERRFSPNWAVQLQAGIPPTITTFGTGAAAPVGTVAKARIWFPTVMALYTFTDVPIVKPYIGVGVNYTFFTNERPSDAYTAALQGTSSSMHLKDSWGLYMRLGLEYPIDQHWSINVEYSTFRLKTKATIITKTPSFGDIGRTIDIKDSPRIFGLTAGYKF